MLVYQSVRHVFFSCKTGETYLPIWLNAYFWFKDEELSSGLLRDGDLGT